jgi:hypothetical protein
VSGTWILLKTYKRPSNRNVNVPLAIALSIVAGITLFFLSRHNGLYNRQVLIVPLATGFVSLFLYLCLHLHDQKYQLLGCVALLSIAICDAGVSKSRITSIPLDEMQKIIDLAKPGGRTCIAFSPANPIFCQDISGLSNDWDLFFPQRIHDSRQLERFHRLWHEGLQRTLYQKPDIILRRAEINVWEQAAAAGLISPDELKALERLRSVYAVSLIGKNEFWIKRGKF